LQGAMDFALIRSFLSTARKQDWNIIDALTRDPSNLVKSLRLSTANLGSNRGSWVKRFCYTIKTDEVFGTHRRSPLRHDRD
jgi:hypothetical protein